MFQWLHDLQDHYPNTTLSIEVLLFVGGCAVTGGALGAVAGATKAAAVASAAAGLCGLAVHGSHYTDNQRHTTTLPTTNQAAQELQEKLDETRQMVTALFQAISTQTETEVQRERDLTQAMQT